MKGAVLLAGIIGTQFIVARPVPRFLVFFGATVLHQTITIGLGVVLGLRPLGSPYAGVAGQALGNAVVGTAAFQLVELLPGYGYRRKTSSSARAESVGGLTFPDSSSRTRTAMLGA